jgi:universal stress protein A
MTYHKILVPLDFSEPSREAMHLAVELAKQGNATLTLFHVYPPLLYPVDPSVYLDLERKQRESAELLLLEAQQELSSPGGSTVEVALAEGSSPFEEIIGKAEQGDYDLIVMGTHGRTGLRRALIGSVAERVVRHAPCSVLIARRKQAQDANEALASR